MHPNQGFTRFDTGTPADPTRTPSDPASTQSRPGDTCATQPQPMQAPRPASPRPGRPAEQLPSSSTAEEAAQVAEEAKQEVAEQVREAREQAVHRSLEFAESQKRRVADELNVFGDAIRQAATKLDEEGHPTVAQYANASADEIRCAAGYLRDKKINELTDDISAFARRRPEIFLGGMFIAGLAISRFLKASPSKVVQEPTLDEQWPHPALPAAYQPETEPVTVLEETETVVNVENETHRSEARQTPQTTGTVPRQPR